MFFWGAHVAPASHDIPMPSQFFEDIPSCSNTCNGHSCDFWAILHGMRWVSPVTVERLAIYDVFFLLGGGSEKIIRMSSRARIFIRCRLQMYVSRSILCLVLTVSYCIYTTYVCLITIWTYGPVICVDRVIRRLYM